MFFFGFDRKIRGLRKKWCKLRLKALKKSKEERNNLLNKLDDIEQQLIILEEQELTRIDRSRISEEIEKNLKEVEKLLKSKKEEQLKNSEYV